MSIRQRIDSNLKLSGYDATKEGITAFQKAYGLEQTGELNEDTTKILSLKRCGMPDTGLTLNNVRIDFYRGQRSQSGRIRVRRGVVTFGFGRRTRDVGRRKQRRAIRRAFKTWGRVLPFRFRKVPVRRATIRVSFTKKRHGDGYPFDGRGGTLAHAFFPCTSSPFCSDVHFDDGERWGLNATRRKIDIQTVALHEIGHSLGLGHSNVAAAVMYAFYQGKRRALNPNDISRIRAIYGSS